MAIVVESVTETLVGANDATPTFNMPATRPDGDLYLAFESGDGAFTGGNFSAWTNVHSTNSENTVSQQIWFRQGSSEPASYTAASGASEEYVYHVVRLSGAHPTAPFATPRVSGVDYIFATGASTAAATAAIVNPAVDNGMVFHHWSIDTDAPTYSSGPAGCTFRGGASSSGGGAGSAYGGLATDNTLTTTGLDTSARTMPGTYDDGWAATAVIVYPPFSPTMDAFRFYIDGTESGSTPDAAQDTNISWAWTTSNLLRHLRVRIQNSAVGSGLSTDDYQLQHSVNGGAWNPTNPTSAYVRAGAAVSSLVDGAATTNRSTDGITDGTGSFVAGEQEEGDGEVEDFQLSVSNFTELVFAFTTFSDSYADGTTTIDFRLALNGGSPGMTNSVVPRLTVTKNASQTVTPTTLALTTTRYAAVVKWGIIGASPTALTTTQYAPVVKWGIIPGALALTTAAFAPTIINPQSATPTTLALTASPFAPVIKHQINAAAPTTLTISLFSAVVGGGVVPTTLALTTAAFAPTIKHQITGAAPTALTTAAFAPSVTVGVRATPTTLAVLTATFAPTVIAPRLVTPTTLALTTALFAPVIKLGVIPGTLAVLTTAFAPTVTATSGSNVTVTPTTLAVVTAAFAPTVATPRLVTPTTLALVATTYAPLALAPRLATPTTLALATATFAPTVLAPRLVTATTAALSVAAFAPTVLAPRLATPATLALATQAYAPTVVLPRLATPTTRALSTETFAPTVLAPRLVTPTTRALTLGGFAPVLSVTEVVYALRSTVSAVAAVLSLRATAQAGQLGVRTTAAAGVLSLRASATAGVLSSRVAATSASLTAVVTAEQE